MCLTHHLWTDLSNQIHSFLSDISLADLVSEGEVQEHTQRQMGKTNTAELLNFVSE
jgi:Rrf2 family iron-sulfur cluster assembly transcriptional regulator